MWTTVLTWLLPAKGALLGWIPGFAQAKTALMTAVVCAVFGAGVTSGVWGERRGEPARIVKAAKPLCDAAAQSAQLQSLEQAVKDERHARESRELALADQTEKLRALQAEKEALENATPTSSTVVVPPGSAWLRGAAKRATKPVVPGNH